MPWVLQHPTMTLAEGGILPLEVNPGVYTFTVQSEHLNLAKQHIYGYCYL